MKGRYEKKESTRVDFRIIGSDALICHVPALQDHSLDGGTYTNSKKLCNDFVLDNMFNLDNTLEPCRVPRREHVRHLRPRQEDQNIQVNHVLTQL